MLKAAAGDAPDWAEFRAQTITGINRDADFSDWHQGRPWFALWALLPEAPELLALHRQLVQAVAPFSLTPYLRQPHLTLSIAGFPCQHALRPDDYDRHRLQQDLDLLQQRCLQPFSVEWSGLGSFALAPYLACRLTPEVAWLHQHLRQTYPLTHAYRPHLTLGLYRKAWPTRDVQRYLQALTVPAGRFDVRCLHLLAYRSHELAGPLWPLGQFDLVTQEFQGGLVLNTSG